jgi:hypothetical protein
MFGGSTALNIKGGHSQKGSLIGVFLTFACLGTLFWYGYLKYQIMREFEDTTVMTSTKELEYDDSVILSDHMNFNVAFAITYYDGDLESIENPNIGRMKAIYREWGLGDYSGILETELPTRPCTMADFGLDDYQDGDTLERLTDFTKNMTDIPGTFFTPVQHQIYYFMTYGHKMKCMDQPLKVQGNYDSWKARNFALVFEKCDNTVEGHTCEPEEVITDWLAGTYVVVVENNWTFRQDEYGEKKLTPDCYFYWHPVSSVIR